MSEPAKVTFKCSECEREIIVDPKLAGQKMRCPNCETLILAPSHSELVDAPKAKTEVKDIEHTAGIQEAPSEIEARALPIQEAPKEEAAPKLVQEKVTVAASSPAPRQVAPSAPASYGPPKTPETPKAGPGRMGALVAVAIALGILVYFGLNIRKSMQLAEDEKSIEAAVSSAEAEYHSGNLEEAAVKAEAAKTLLGTKSNSLDLAKIMKWKEALKTIAEQKEQLDQLRAKVASLTMENAAKVRADLENLQALYNKASQEKADPKGGADKTHREYEKLIGEATLAIDRARQLEQQKILTDFRGEVEALEQKLSAGDFDKSDKATNDLRTRFEHYSDQDKALGLRIDLLDTIAQKYAQIVVMKKNAPADYAKAIKDLEHLQSGLNQNPLQLALSKQIDSVLKQLREEDRAKRSAQIKGVLQTASQDFDEAKKKLDQLEKELDQSDAHKTLRDEIKLARRKLADEVAKFNRLTQKDLEELTRIGERLHEIIPDLYVRESNRSQGCGLEMDDQNFSLYSIERDPNNKSQVAGLVFSVQGQLFKVGQDEFDKHLSLSMHVLAQAVKGLKEAKPGEGPPWHLVLDAPFCAAKRKVGDKTEFFFKDKVFTGEELPKVSFKDAETQLAKAAEALAAPIEADKTFSSEVSGAIAYFIRGAYKSLDHNDYIDNAFCRQSIYEGYVEQNMPGAAEKYKTQLAAFKDACKVFMELIPSYKGKGATGEEFEQFGSHEGHAVYRLYDPKLETTVFGIKTAQDEVAERQYSYSVYELPGKLDKFPDNPQPKVVHMAHPSMGAVATYHPDTGKLDFDPDQWARYARNACFQMKNGGRPSFVGSAEWEFPPHVLLVNVMNDVKGLVTPAGKVDLKSFGNIADPVQRKAAEDKYLDELAKVLNTTGHLHLYFLYFHQYVLDSPEVKNLNVIGNHLYSGDIHQNVYQSLDRFMAGRHLGDCDDLAEVYHEITRRQGKQSFVMSLPAHAACGWLEKLGEHRFRFQFIDTGFPRIEEGDDVEKVIEALSRTYDRDKTMHFDPKQVGFLFRFAEEPTRTPYVLSSRMFYDPPYAETMIRVQSYWHFHVYALGIKTMEDLIGKGDRVNENCVELAGLYERVKETERSAFWTNEALKQLNADDLLSRYSEKHRIGRMYLEDHDRVKAYEGIKDTVEELKTLYKDPQTMRYAFNRLEFANLLTEMGRPFEAWALIHKDAQLFFERNLIRLEHAGCVTGIYVEIKNQIEQDKKQLSEEEKTALGEVEKFLEAFYTQKLFTEDDDYDNFLRKYGFMARYYGAKYGHQRLLDELFKDGPYPDGERNHRAHTGGEEEDWKWIRMSPMSYIFAVGDAIDPKNPPEKWRKEEAVKLIEALGRAAEKARTMGGLSNLDFAISGMNVVYAFLTKKFDKFEEVLKEVKDKDFAAFTLEIAETFGQSARFVTPDEWAAQFKLFSKYVDKRASYFAAVYEAFREGGLEHARRGAQMTVERWPQEETYKQEQKYLEDLIKKRQAKDQKEGKKEEGPPLPVPMPPKEPPKQ